MKEHTSGFWFARWLAAAVVLAFVLSAASFGSSAYAEDPMQGTVDAGNGWVLTYEASSGSATITGVSTEGKGKLSIPSVADGMPVTALGMGAFKGTSVVEVSIPSSVAGVSKQCFRDCTSLTDVTFENDTTGFIGQYSFAGCTALTEFDIPVLTSYDANENYKLTNNSFLDCVNLKTVRFLSNGNTTAGYYSDYSVNSMMTAIFGNCGKLDTFVYYCTPDEFTRWQDASGNIKFFYTLDIYPSESDAADYSKKAASVTCKSGTKLSDILAGTVSPDDLYGDVVGAIPSLPSGKVWGVSGYGRKALDWGLYSSYSAFPVDSSDLNYAWLMSPQIKNYTDLGLQDTYWAYQRARFTLNKAGTGVPGFSDVVVQASDGSELPSGTYKIEYEKRIDTAASVNVYEPVSSISAAGLYRARAVAAGSNSHASSATDYVDIEVVTYSITTKAYDTISDAVFSIAGSHAGEAAYAVVAPTSSWQYAFIGAGLAAAGNGVLVDSANDSISSASLRSIVANGADSVLALGGGSQLSQSVINQIQGQSLFSRGGGVTSMTASSVQDMAVQAYNNIRQYGASRFANTAEWGTSAVVMSPNQAFNTVSVAECVFAKKAPVFFTDAKGALPASVVSILSSGSFSEVVVAGPSSLVPDATLSQIAGMPGVSATRQLDSASSSGEANRVFTAASASGLGLSPSKVVVASMSDVFNAILGAQVAVDNGAVLYTCASTADGKAIQALADANGAQSVWFVGSFGATDPKVVDRIASTATASPMSTSVGKGDTFEQGSLVFAITGSGTSGLNSVLDKATTSVTVPASVGFGGTSYSVKSIASNAFEGCTALKTVSVSSKAVTSIADSTYANLTKLAGVTYASAVASIGKSAFSGCTALTSVNANVQKASKIGAAAFRDCKKLKKIAFTSTKLSAIPANSFNGCKALQSAQFSSSKMKSIGASAFAKCSKLKAVTLKTTKLTAKKVGKSAFSGIANKAKVKVPKSKVKAYTAIFRAKGLPKKATVVAG